MVESSTFLKILFEQFCRREYFFFLFRKLALVKIAIQVYQLLGGKYMAFFSHFITYDFFPVLPPFLNRQRVFHLHWFGLGEVLVAFRHIKAVEPCFFGFESFFATIGSLIIKEEYVGCNRGIWRKYRTRQTDDSMQIELAEKILF